MEYIDRNIAKELVGKALSEVADFSGDFEGYTFEQFRPFHTKVFLGSLKNLVNLTQCSDQNGNLTNNEYFDIDLSVTSSKKWDKMSDCIENVVKSHYRVISPTGKIHLP